MWTLHMRSNCFVCNLYESHWFKHQTCIQASLCSWDVWGKDSYFVNVWNCVNTVSWQRLYMAAVWHQPIIYPQVENIQSIICSLEEPGGIWRGEQILKASWQASEDAYVCTAVTWCVAPREALWNQADCNKLRCIRVSSSMARLRREANWHRQVGLPYSPLNQVVESKLGSHRKRGELGVLTGACFASSCTRAVWPQTPSACCAASETLTENRKKHQKQQPCCFCCRKQRIAEESRASWTQAVNANLNWMQEWRGEEQKPSGWLCRILSRCPSTSIQLAALVIHIYFWNKARIATDWGLFLQPLQKI